MSETEILHTMLFLQHTAGKLPKCNDDTLPLLATTALRVIDRLIEERDALRETIVRQEAALARHNLSPQDF